MKRALTEVIRMLIDAAWRRRYLVCVPVVLMIPLSILGAMFAPRSYEAKTILLLQETGKENPFLKDLVVGLHVKERMSALKALVKSEHVLLNVLRDIRTAEELSDAKRVAIDLRLLSGAISVELIGSDLVELRLKGDRSEGMGRTLAAIKQRFLERLLSPEQSTLGATRTFLSEQLAIRKAVLDAAERALADFRARHADKLPAIYASNVQRLAALKQQLQEKEMQLAAARAGFEDMKQQIVSANPVVGRLEEGIVQVTAELTSLRARYTDAHSDVQAAERRLSRLQSERRAYLAVSREIETADIDRLWSIAAAGNSDPQKSPPLLVSQLIRLQEAKAKQIVLEKDVETLSNAAQALQAAIAEFAPIEQEQARLEKGIVAARQTYEAFQERFDKANTSFALGRFEEPERIKVIDAPQDPTMPTTPPKFIFVIAGTLAGILLGGGLAFVAELLDQRVRSSTQFAELTGLPVVVRLPCPQVSADADEAAAKPLPRLVARLVDSLRSHAPKVV